MTGHLAEHDLVRLLDEGAGVGDEGRAAHLLTCGECSARRATLERRSQRLHDLLRAGDPAPRILEPPAAALVRAAERRRALRPWRIAAALAALLLGSVAVPPVRAWIVRTTSALLAGVRAGAEQPAAPGPSVAADTAGVVTFTPGGPELTLEVAARQGTGALHVETVPGTDVSAFVVGERRAAEVVIHPDRVRILNEARATTSYRVTVPLTLSTIVVRIGDEEPVLLRPGRTGERWQFDLRPQRAP